MIKGKGNFKKVAGIVRAPEWDEVCSKLPNGEDYVFVVADVKKSRNAPYLTFLFSGVLGFISSQLSGNPPTEALYRYFEAMFAPLHVSYIDGRRFEYRDLKSEKKNDVCEVIEKIAEYARQQWGMEIPTQDELNEIENRVEKCQLYLGQEVEWSNFISSRNKSKDAKRRTETERI